MPEQPARPNDDDAPSGMPDEAPDDVPLGVPQGADRDEARLPGLPETEPPSGG